MAGEAPYDKKRTIADILAKLSTFKDRILWNLVKDLKPRYLIGVKSDSTPIDIHDSDGLPTLLMRPEEKVSTYSHTPATNADPGITIPAGEYWYVTGLNAAFIMDAGVADRSCRILIRPLAAKTLTNATSHWGSSVISLQASEDGQIDVGEGSYYTYSDNGTMGTTATNPLPRIYGPGTVFTTETTNSEAGDRHGLTVTYRKCVFDTANTV